VATPLSKNFARKRSRENRVGYLETLAEPLAKSRRAPVERLLGESVARLLDDHHSKAASAILDQTESILSGPARFRYIVGTFAVTALALATLAVLWVWRHATRELIGTSAVEVVVAAAMGSIGTTLSIIMRSGDLSVGSNRFCCYAVCGRCLPHHSWSYRRAVGGAGDQG